MPVLRQEDEEFGFQVDQNEEEESSEEETEEDSEDADDDDESGEESGDEATEDDSEDESGDGTTEDDDDDDDDDEEETTDDDDKDGESEESDDDDDDEETFEDEEGGLVSGEPKQIDDADAKRRKMIGATVICVLLLALILGLGLGLGLKDDDPDPTPAPTPARTPVPTTAAPVAPSEAPTGVNATLDPTMDMEGVVVVSAQFDTTIYVDGQDQGGEFGSQDTMLVQGGDPGDNDLPRAYSLVQFELDGTEVDMLMEPVEAEFCLTHVINEGSADRIVTYTTCAVPFDSNVNNLTGSTATYILPDDCLSGETVEFDLSPTSDLVCIGVRGLLMSLTGTGGGNETTARLRGRWRQLQDDRLLQVGGPDLQDELMLPEGPVVMAIYLSGDSTESGDRFYTSNDVEGRGPELNFVSMADTPTMIPSSNMTLGPYEPCNICGGDLSVSLPDAVITVDDEMGQVTCATLEAACFGGYCESTQCNTLIQLTGDLCGCAAADSTENPDATDPPTIPEPNNDPCNICGVGLNVTIPDGIVPELDGQTCETVALACFSGFCNATVCELLPVVAQEPCGCSGGDIEV